MIAAFRAELIRLRQPRVLGAVGGLIVALSVLATALSMTLVGNDVSAIGRNRPGGITLSLGQLAQADGAAKGFLIGSGFAGIVILIAFAVNIAGEFGHGTIRNLLLLEPRRVRLLAGKVSAMLAMTALGLFVGELFGVSTAMIVAGIRGIPMHEWATVDGVSAVVSAYGDALVAAIGWGLLGATAAIVFRSVPVALAVAVAWVFPLENILHNAWPTADKWFPGLLLQGIGIGTGGAVSWSRAVGVFVVYGLVLAMISAVSFARRDVTA
jgi:ABC-2 type transport system permease protein